MYLPIAERLRDALRSAGATKVVDLCSGSGGPWLRLSEVIDGDEGRLADVRLTDFYPNVPAMELASEQTGERLSYSIEPVDARHVPDRLDGFRTLFTSFHHFRPDDAKAILQNAVNAGEGIAIFEATKRAWLPTLAMLLTPIIVLLVTPLIRPFRWTRLLWTYPVPLVPLFVPFDGVVSCLRTYSTRELRDMTAALSGPEYHWEIGEEPVKGAPCPITYAIGYPAKPGAADV